MKNYRVRFRIMNHTTADTIITVDISAKHDSGAVYRATRLFSEDVVADGDGLEVLDVTELTNLEDGP